MRLHLILFSMMRIGFNLEKRPEVRPNLALYSTWSELCWHGAEATYSLVKPAPMKPQQLVGLEWQHLLHF